MTRLLPLLVSGFLLFTIQPWRAQGQALIFDKLLVFPDGNQVRIETALKSSKHLDDVELSGAITHAKTGHLLWQGSWGRTNFRTGTTSVVTQMVSGLKPELWSPASPTLYNLKVTAKKGKVLAEDTVRFGFRSFASRHGNFVLNGRPIFLRGLAINPPGRTIPAEAGESRAFAEAYVRFLKSQNVNTIRLTHDSQIWFDVCDELGMIVYQGQYGSPLETGRGKQGPPADFEKSLAAYKRLFETYARHPAILIYVLSNELPVSGTRGREFHDFLSRAHSELKPWDSTRLYIGNAGYGEGREGDICDVHRYWGWYYNTFLTYYNLRDQTLFGDASKDQPVTFTECVGSFTGPLGEFNSIVRKQLGAQLNWTGHSASQREDALNYQSFIVKQTTETFRRLRPINPRLSGIMPFTILFYNWSGIHSFEQMKAKPAMDQMAISYQPVLLSWELWTSQVYAGSTIHPTAHVINDAEDGAVLANATLIYQLNAKDGREVMRAEVKLPDIPYYGAWSKRLAVKVPSDLPAGNYHLSGRIVSERRTISKNETDLFVAGKEWDGSPGPLEEPVSLYDPAGPTAASLEKLGVPFKKIHDFAQGPPPGRALIIGEGAADSSLNAATMKLKQFVRGGGRILCLQPKPGAFNLDWLPEPVTFFTASANAATYPPSSRPFSGNMNINPERPDHPVFNGLNRQRLALWSDYTDWDQTRPGFPRVFPVTAGYKLTKSESLGRTAILANYDRGLEGVALCEMFDGEGSVLLSGFDLTARSGLDPAADRLLMNLVRYAASRASHEIHPLIEKPVRWGNYASEHGLITGPLNGLVVNSDWVRPPTNPSAAPLTQAQGEWNTKPGDQFLPHGRCALGPFGYSTGSSLKDLDPSSKIGSGIFWARIPSGKTKLITSVENRSSEPGSIRVTTDERVPGAEVAIPPGKTMSVTTPLRGERTNICVRYTASKSLVLLQTEFE